jgi:dihydropteroate synthase
LRSPVHATSLSQVLEAARQNRCAAVMGILNVTPDSFSDGGRFFTPDAALHQARRMCAEGAAIIDVGGESTRPGAPSVPVAEELDRVLSVIEAIHAELPVLISIDTSKPQVMRAAVSAGAGLINDVRALRAEGAIEAVRDLGVPVCLMHMQGEPKTMQLAPTYAHVVGEVREFLAQRVSACEAHGIVRDRLIIDPGFGFGKTLEQNLCLLSALDTFAALGLPVLVGLSRKSMLGALLNKPVGERLYGSLALSVLAALNGAAIIRAHDVGPTVEALKVTAAVTCHERAVVT